MKILVTTPLIGYDKKPILLKEGEIEEPILVRNILVNSLNFISGNLRGDAKQTVRAYQLSIEIMDNDEVTLTSEDIVFIKERMLAMYTPVVYAQVANLLEGEEAKK